MTEEPPASDAATDENITDDTSGENTTATATPSAESDADAPTEETAPQTEGVQPTTEPVNGYYWGLGRRKSAVARVRIKPGDGKFLINKRSIKDYFSTDHDRKAIRQPQEATQTAKSIDVFVNVVGGGTTGQAGAIILGVARALCAMTPDYQESLRDGKFLTRDPREVERKKYGQRGARRRFQFSKR